MLPHDFPPWGTVYAYYRDWMQTGLIESLRERLARSR
jgi:transposase